MKYSKNNTVSVLVSRAREGDLTARAMLIEKYMYIVDSYLKKQNIAISDDIRQEGYIVLLRCINNYLSLDTNIPISTAVYHYIDACFPNSIKKFNQKENNFYIVKEKMDEAIVTESETQEFLFEKFELEDFIKREVRNDKDREALLRRLNDETLEEIARALNVSRARAHQRTIRSRELIKEFKRG